MSFDVLAREIARLADTIHHGDLRTLDVLTIEEFARIFRVDHKTASRWHDKGRIPREAIFRTPGGHRRIYEVYVHRLLHECGVTDPVERSNMIQAARDWAGRDTPDQQVA